MRGESYCFRVRGNVNHRGADICEEDPKFGNVYLLDPDEQLATRLNVFDNVNQQLLKQLQSMLIETNPLVNVYQQLTNRHLGHFPILNLQH